MIHDPGATPNPDFPRLTPTNHRVTSPASTAYNCIAWAAHDVTRWWQPGRYWPSRVDVPTGSFMQLVQMFADLGFRECEGPDPEPGFEKVALYTEGGGLYTHAARSLPSGRWTSKLGETEDIEHDTPDDVAGGIYGEVFGFMRRPLPPSA